MKRTIAVLAAIVLCAVGPADADYSVTGKGTWPKSWPKDLEPLRKQSSTFEGPLAAHQHYAIPCTKQEEFESASKLASALSSPFGGGDSWTALELVPEALAGVTGRVQYPPPFGAS